MKKKALQAGAGDESPGGKEEFWLIPRETLKGLYAKLLKCRTQEKRRGARRRFDAALVGAAMDLGAGDTVVSEENALLAMLLGAKLKGTRDTHAERLQLALGAALDHKTGKTRKVTAVFARDADDAEWVAALKSALKQSLPMVFVHETEIDRARPMGMAALLAALEPGTEMPVITVDGDDVIAVYRVAHEAIDRARRDRGPTLIECVEFDVEGVPKRDAVANMESYLRGKGMLGQGIKREPPDRRARSAQ